jgi:hypothetical protein
MKASESQNLGAPSRLWSFLRVAPVLCSIVLALTQVLSAQDKSNSKIPNAQQASSTAAFSSEEDSLPGAVALPECARPWLARDAHVSLRLDHLHLSLAQLPGDWFVAGAVNLAKPNEKLIVVMGTGELRWTNTSPFWVMRWSRQSCDLLLTTAAHHLEFLDTKTLGFPDVQIGFASTGNTSKHQYKFDGRAYMEADDACRPEQAAQFSAIEGKNPQMVLFQRPGHSAENLLCEGRDWVSRKWEQKEPFDLMIKLFSKEGEQTSLSYSDLKADAGWRIVILVHKEIVDESAHPAASHRVAKDELILAVAVERRFARKGDPDRTRIVPEGESVPPDAYELHFLDEAGRDVAML